jgi:hypothetical protein
MKRIPNPTRSGHSKKNMERENNIWCNRWEKLRKLSQRTFNVYF